MLITNPLAISIYRGINSANYGAKMILSPGGIFSGITYTQSGNLTYFDSTGTLKTAAVDTMVLDYDPSTLALRGYPFWEARTNSIRNNTMVGNAAGSPGTVPNNWNVTSTGGSITRTIVGSGQDSGIEYIDIRFVFSGAANADVQFDGAVAAALNGQSWTASQYVRLVGGALTNITVTQILAEYSAVPAFLAATTTNIVPTSAALNTQRFAQTRTNNQATTAFEVSTLRFAASGVADCTLRIGLPQLELGAFATAVEKTSSAAVTRAAPSPTITGSNLTSFYTAPFSQVVEFMVATTVAGTRPIVSYDDGTANNQIRLYASGTSLKLTVTVGGVTQADITIGTIAALTAYKVAFRVSASGCAASLAGAAVQTGSGTVPSVTIGRIGTDFAGNVGNVWVKSDSFYAAGLPNASLVGLAS